jgi:hypothetical protein
MQMGEQDIDTSQVLGEVLAQAADPGSGVQNKEIPTRSLDRYT